MRHALRLIAVMLGIATTPFAVAASEPMSTAHLPLLRTLSSPVFSPTEEWIAVSSSRADRQADVVVQEILLVSPRGERVEVGRGINPRWSPDGRLLAFQSQRDGKPGLWVFEVATREARKVATLFPSDHFLGHEADKSAAFSPRGDAIAFLSAEESPATSVPSSPTPKVIGRALFKNRTGLSDGRPTHIWVVAVSGMAKPRLVTPGRFNEHSISWSPDGTTIAFVSHRGKHADEETSDDLWTVDVETGKLTRLTETPGTEMHPTFSPDGTRIAYLATSRPTNTRDSPMEDPDIYVLPKTGGAPRNLTTGLDRRPSSILWHPNGTKILAVVDEEGRRPVVQVTAPLTAAEPTKVSIVDNGYFQVQDLTLDRDGDRMAVVRSDLVAPTELYLLDLARGRSSRLTNENQAFLARVALKNADMMWSTSPDGTRVQSWLTKPVNFREGEKYPLILWVHGGPHGMMGYTFTERVQILAAQGFGVLYVNPRGSTGYGQVFADGTRSDWGGGDAKDLLAALDHAITKYTWIDADRLGIAGGSYGGYMANWLITQTDRFKAAVAFAAISNLVSFYGTSVYPDLLEVEYGGPPWQGEIAHELWQRSPLAHVAKVKTPTLFLHGENDQDVPIAQAEEMYVALKRRRIKTLMVRYPGEGHVVRRPSLAADFYARMTEWFDTHLRQPIVPVPARLPTSSGAELEKPSPP